MMRARDAAAPAATATAQAGRVNLKSNIAANAAGRLWPALLSFALVPVYIRYLGIEAYGIIGFYVSLNAVISILDFGLTTTVNRELARLSATPGTEQARTDLVRTLETVYWAIAVAIGLVVVGGAPLAAHRWLHPQHLSPAAVQSALVVIGLVVAMQWPDSFYAGGLLGLERQVELNWIRIAFATVQGPGVVALLAFVAPTLQVYFGWQLIVVSAQTLTLAWCLWRALPRTSQRPRFRAHVLSGTWRLASGITVVAITAVVLTQADKVLLSRALPLRAFGYYALATTAAGVVGFVALPVNLAVFPRFARLAALDAGRDLARLYHRSCQLVAVVLMPAWAVGVLFSRELIGAYVRRADVAAHVAPLFALLVTGTALNSIMSLPYSLQLAFGWTRLSIYKNLMAIVVFIPALAYMVWSLGARGAAYLWILLNLSYLLLEPPVMHRRLLRGELLRWYAWDFSAPLAAALVGVGAVRLVAPASGSMVQVACWSAAAAILGMAAAAAATPLARDAIRFGRAHAAWAAVGGVGGSQQSRCAELTNLDERVDPACEARLAPLGRVESRAADGQ